MKIWLQLNCIATYLLYDIEILHNLALYNI